MAYVEINGPGPIRWGETHFDMIWLHGNNLLSAKISSKSSNLRDETNRS